MDKLIFVYNADGALFAQVTDYAHKLLKPETYQCNLCKLTYSNFGMKDEWKKFISTLPYQIEFLHRDEFAKQYPDQKNAKFPAVYVGRDTITLLATAHEINQATNLPALKTLIIDKLSERTHS